jgi:flagellar assembly protein FliH
MSCEPLVLRGEAADAARPVTFGHQPTPAEVLATGPWADAFAAARAAGYEQGHREGVEAGRRAGAAAARHEVTARASRALGALDDATARVAAIDAASATDLAPRVVELALELTRMLLQRELAATDEPAREALARALPLVPDRGPLVVRLNPADYDGLGGVDDLVPGRDVTVVADPSLASGDAVVDVGPCRVESRLDEALERVAEALRVREVSS